MISVSALQQNNKVIYVGILSTLIVFVNGLYPGIGPFLTLGHSTGSFIPRFDIRIGVWSGSSQVQ